MNACADFPGLAAFNLPAALVYGIGNVGRQDDGLGWAAIDWLEAASLCPQAELQRHYQLHLEDADLISRKERVLFIDATRDETVASFRLERAEAKLDLSFASHAISIPSVMATCRQCFGRVPDVHVLAIRGYAWGLDIGLSAGAQRNLELAIASFATRGAPPVFQS